MVASALLGRPWGMWVRTLAGNHEPALPGHCGEPIFVGFAIKLLPILVHRLL